MVLISGDVDVERKIKALSVTQKDRPIVIPFSYSELATLREPYFVRNRFRKFFYSRDLFDFSSPLKNELYFFARSHLVQMFVNKHRSGEHAGLFGLRKSGKTSIIYAVERSLKAAKSNYVSIDCESPSIHGLRWYELLEKIVAEYKKSISAKLEISFGERYAPKLAADSFEEDMLALFNSKANSKALFLFDEIERITPGTASSRHWNEEEDFIFFWQAMRGFFQKNPEVMTYMLVGTNPSCTEKSKFNGHENPIYASVSTKYIPRFEVSEVKEMVKNLGSYIGMSFEELIYSKLADDFGGHPFLIRQMCSRLNLYCTGDRPVRIDKGIYEKVKDTFYRDSTHYFEMIVGVLKEWYPAEFDMLKYLAQGDQKTFEELSSLGPELTRHLEGYGLISPSESTHVFNIEIMNKYLGELFQYERKNLSTSEMIAEISKRRNKLEMRLRKVIKRVMKIAYGNSAIKKVLESIPAARREYFVDFGINQILAEDKSPLYFVELSNLIQREWKHFQNIFDMDKAKFRIIMEDINKQRIDAHAKSIPEEDLAQVRLHFNKMKNILDEWD